MPTTDLRARFDELAMEGIRPDSFISTASGTGSGSGSEYQSSASERDGRRSGYTMRSVMGSKGVTTGKRAPHPFSLPATPTTPSHSRSRTTHPFASSWALKTAAPSMSPGHLRSQSAIPSLSSASAPPISALSVHDKSKSFAPLSPDDEGDDADTTPTAERVRPKGGIPLLTPVEPDAPSPLNYPPRPSSQPAFALSASDDEDDPYLVSATHGLNKAALLHKRSMSTTSSASSISLPLPYRPSMSSDTSPLLPNLPPTPADLPRPKTINKLDPIQKELLRRRTRKLEQLLGTTHFASGGLEDESTAPICLPTRGETAQDLLNRRPSTAGAKLVRSRTASGPPSSKSQTGKFPAPVSPLPRMPSISTLNSEAGGVPVTSPSLSVSSEWEDDPVEKDKRRRRQTLQKIHRYLGIVVPAEVVAPSTTGLATPLPLPAELPSPGASGWAWEDKKPAWKTLFTRSTGVPKLDDAVWKPNAVSVGSGTRHIDALKEDTGTKSTPEERARNVRRAAKMEQLFGSPPPPALYVTRPAGVPVSPLLDSPISPKSPLLPGMRRRAKSHDSPSRPDGIIVTTEEEVERDEPSGVPPIPPVPIGLGIGPGAKHKRERIRSDGDLVEITADGPVTEMGELDGRDREGASFKSYRRSLASLDYLTQAGNRNSLATLLQFVSESEDIEGQDPFVAPSRTSSLSPALSHAPSPSLEMVASSTTTKHDPETASLVSVALSTTESIDVVPPAPPAWKRAAKLRKFFGVSYRELFDQLLERIEAGAREDMERGALTRQEFEIVVAELRALRDRREGLSSDLLR